LAETSISPKQHVEVSEDVADLTDILMIGALIDVMREEGIAYGAAMADEMFAGQGGPGWQAMVSRIYDADTMKRRFSTAFSVALAGSSEIAAMRSFFGSALGQRVLTLEIAARRALLDPEIEEAARLGFSEMEAAGDARVRALQSFVIINDLIESNVMGAMNANVAYYQGLAEVAPIEDAMSEDEVLAEVWAQETDVRKETVEWLFPFLALAYRPLNDADLKAYQDFCDSKAGQAVNAALFAAFDAVFVAISRDIGRAAAAHLQGQEL